MYPSIMFLASEKTSDLQKITKAESAVQYASLGFL